MLRSKILNYDKARSYKDIESTFNEIENDYVRSEYLPTDKRIVKLANAFYERDRNRQIEVDAEGMAVMRGIIQGMQLMRQIIESK